MKNIALVQCILLVINMKGTLNCICHQRHDISYDIMTLITLFIFIPVYNEILLF